MFQQANYGSPYQTGFSGFSGQWQANGSPQQQLQQMCQQLQQSEQRHAQILQQIQSEEQRAASQLQQCVQLVQQLSNQQGGYQQQAFSWQQQPQQFRSQFSPAAQLPHA